MGILVVGSFASTALLIACYDPESRDCTVTCSATDECVDDQVCGNDGYCAVPLRAGQCDDPHRTPDPEAPDASSPYVSLRVIIEGRGRVHVVDVGTCDSQSAPNGTCTFTVLTHLPRLLKAQEGDGREFIAWTTTCAGSIKTCVVTPVMPLTIVGAEFE